MKIDLRKWLSSVAKFVRLSELSLAGKCRVLFGLAVVLILAVALLIPYAWMNKLKDNAALDIGRGASVSVYRDHFRPGSGGELAPLDETGAARTSEPPSVRWVKLRGGIPRPELPDGQNEAIDLLLAADEMLEHYWYDKIATRAYTNYARLVRAEENCIRCHSADGTAMAFNRNEPVGAILVRVPAGDREKIAMMNLIWTIVAGLLAGAGAIVTFYVIVQQIILSPVRQLRAIANNVAAGNLDVRSSISTADEYAKLSSAFNHMLDSLQQSQQQLRKANKELDAKIVELSDRNIELYRANKLKSEFLANISHEFRTPLNAILGFAEILRERPGADVEKSKRYAENIITSGRSLLAMINDLLDLAKAESGKIEMHIERTSITELCENLQNFFMPMALKKGLTLNLYCDKNIPIVRTDAGKVQQIVCNFLSNAIKFTPEQGRIDIRTTLADERTIRIAVCDTGQGIAPQDHERIFEKFRQIDGSITRQTTGTGLGLAISKELATLISAAISLRSQPGHGATFMLDIPVALCEDEEPAEFSTAKQGTRQKGTA